MSTARSTAPTTLSRPPAGRRRRRPQARPAIPKLIVALRTLLVARPLPPISPPGITVGLVALPLAMAFAISSGLPPSRASTRAIITGFLISALGGSMVQIGGPTGAFVVVVSGIVAQHGAEGLFMCTMMAGVMLVILGATGMGSAIRFIPRPVVVGFTNGIAIIIASTQIKDFFGLTVDEHARRLRRARMATLARQPADNRRRPRPASPAAVLVVLVLRRSGSTRVPGAHRRAVRRHARRRARRACRSTPSSRGSTASRAACPTCSVPALRLDLVLTLLTPAFTVAMLGGIESLMSAVVADRMSGDRHNPNVELVAQGVANIASPLFGGLPATGALARTATNVRSGARTPIAGIVHALTLLDGACCSPRRWPATSRCRCWPPS